MQDLGKLKKNELIAMVEDLQLENISLKAEVKILRDKFPKEPSVVYKEWRGTTESFGDNAPHIE